MSFNVGDKVIHSAHGFAEIINIESKMVSGQPVDYYVIKTKDLQAWIPVASASNDSIRLPISKSNFSKLFPILREHNHPFSIIRSERKSDIHIRLNEGNTKSICSLIRDLSYYRKSRKLNEYESSIYERAVRMLIDEWQYSMSTTQVQATRDLNSLLDESYKLSTEVS